MSVCVVAKYPWRGAREAAQGEPEGVIVCSDTRVTSPAGRLPWLCAKQRPLGRNVFACFTSSNAGATTKALDQTIRTRDLRQIGSALRDVHGRFGGCTELLVVAWRRKFPPRIYEVMPPAYRPEEREGVVGIGDIGVLNWFRENFEEIPKLPETPELPPWALEALEVQIGQRFLPPPPPGFGIQQAAVQVAATFSEGIIRAGGPTVSLPIETAVITLGKGEWIQLTSSADLETFEDITTKRTTVKTPRTLPPVVAKDPTRRRAEQLAR